MEGGSSSSDTRPGLAVRNDSVDGVGRRSCSDEAGPSDVNVEVDWGVSGLGGAVVSGVWLGAGEEGTAKGEGVAVGGGGSGASRGLVRSEPGIGEGTVGV